MRAYLRDSDIEIIWIDDLPLPPEDPQGTFEGV